MQLSEHIGDSEHITRGRQDAVRDANAEIQRVLLENYPDFADQLDWAADELLAEQRALAEAQAQRKQAHAHRYAELQQAAPALYPLTSQSRIGADTLRPQNRLDVPSSYSQAGDLLVRDDWPDWLKTTVTASRNLTPRHHEGALV